MGPRFLIALTRSGTRLHAVRHSEATRKDAQTLCGLRVALAASVQEFISYDETNCKRCSATAVREDR